jgi:hypothetical protein
MRVGRDVHFAFHASGEQSEDAVYTGDEMSGEADALIDAAGEVIREVTRAEIDSDNAAGVDEDEGEEDA